MKALFAVVLLFASLASVPTLMGQDEEIVEMRSIQFAAYGDDLFLDLRFEVSKERVVKLKFYPDRRTNPFSVPLDKRRVVFFRERLAENGVTVIREPQAEVDFTGIGDKALLVFTVSSFGELPYEVLVLDESESEFSAGMVRFLNLTGVELRARFGERLFGLPLGISETLVSFDFDAGEPQSLSLAVMGANEDYELVYSSSASLDRGRGVLYVVKPPQTTNGRIVSVRRLW